MSLEMLHRGRWLQDSPKHHIEEECEEFVKEYRDQKNLRHLSLVENLEALDLKACHNLETLPSDISPLRYLIHLDLSQCYLLDRMPKGIENLIRLRVLKGFVLGSSSKTPCRNIRSCEFEIPKAIQHTYSKWGYDPRLKVLSKLEHFKISWDVFDTSCILKAFLTKIFQKPSKLPEGFTQLNITGGKLKSLDDGENDNIFWHMQILKLLDINLTNLQELFPLLRYAEIKQILNQYISFTSIIHYATHI
ncbi:hypothetical protein HKD37_02G004944 [Glycine soja]